MHRLGCGMIRIVSRDLDFEGEMDSCSIEIVIGNCVGQIAFELGMIVTVRNMNWSDAMAAHVIDQQAIAALHLQKLAIREPVAECSCPATTETLPVQCWCFGNCFAAADVAGIVVVASYCAYSVSSCRWHYDFAFVGWHFGAMQSMDCFVVAFADCSN